MLAHVFETNLNYLPSTRMKRKSEQTAPNSPSKKKKTADDTRTPTLPSEMIMSILVEKPAAWLGITKELNEIALRELLNNKLVDPKKQLLHLLDVTIQKGGYTAMKILIEHKEFKKQKPIFMHRHYNSCLENASHRGFHNIVLFLLQWALKKHEKAIISAYQASSIRLQLKVMEVFISFLKQTPGTELVIEAGLHNALFSACNNLDYLSIRRLLQQHEFRSTPLLDAFRKVCGPTEESKAIAGLLRAKIAPHINHDELNEIERQSTEWNSRYYEVKF